MRHVKAKNEQSVQEGTEKTKHKFSDQRSGANFSFTEGKNFPKSQIKNH